MLANRPQKFRRSETAVAVVIVIVTSRGEAIEATRDVAAREPKLGARRGTATCHSRANCPNRPHRRALRARNSSRATREPLGHLKIWTCSVRANLALMILTTSMIPTTQWRNEAQVRQSNPAKRVRVPDGDGDGGDAEAAMTVGKLRGLTVVSRRKRPLPGWRTTWNRSVPIWGLPLGTQWRRI